MDDRDEAKRLLSAAQKDLTALRSMTDSSAFAEEIFGFHAQQAIEKSLKAWLAIIGEQYPRTHDVSLLLALLKEHGEHIEVFNDLIEFNPFAVEFRYEAFEDLGEPLERDMVITRVADMVYRVQRLIENRKLKEDEH
jgi:HEPN domain-containing protein